MPTYDAQCSVCGETQAYCRAVNDRMDTPQCCGIPMQKVILTAPKGFIFGKFDPFLSPVDGSTIRTKRELQEHNKRNNVVSMADGYSDEKIKAGLTTKPAAPLVDRADLEKDVAQAINMVRDGYKPTIEVHDDN